MTTVTETHLSAVPLSRRGKVRELYDLGDTLLLVASDRISAFDVVLSPGIPDKGKILTQLSNFWFRKFADVENHVLETDVARFPEALAADTALLAGRAVLARKCEVIPFECVARGYLVGSGWADYRKTGAVCGIPLPKGMREAERLTEPIFTPATKAEHGHDENVSFETMAGALPEGEAERLRDLTLSLYARAAEFAASRGLILADTKLEFGRFEGRIVWIDEAFTPDSSRYWTPPSTRRAAASRPSTSSSCGTGSNPPAGTSARPLPGCPRAWYEPRARNTSTPTASSRTLCRNISPRRSGER